MLDYMGESNKASTMIQMCESRNEDLDLEEAFDENFWSQVNVRALRLLSVNFS